MLRNTDTWISCRIAYPICNRHGYAADTYPRRIRELGRIGPENLRLDMYLIGYGSVTAHLKGHPCCPNPTPPRAAARPAPPRATRAATRGRPPPEQPPPLPATTSHGRSPQGTQDQELPAWR
ncbi:hypothetical protein PVAP13_3NG182571 [Panicum virgatum]|uniref:Uncharacterized protein n=1 Tax=Panicum virgatum TaxID=38727 RepID=A0A8T0UEP3_PANVG|nr:hypothetical protein PVAP13_3NG182571 [Panicum virgatum]